MSNVRQRHIAHANALRGRGYTHQEIADRLGLSRSYIRNLFYDPDGSKDRARKESYRGSCEICGRPTTGSDGPNNAPKRCHRHPKAKYWTRERVIDAIQRFAAEHGRPPFSEEWVKANPDKGYPSRGAVYRSSSNSSAPFAKWADAIEAAGFPRPVIGRKVHRRGSRRRSIEERLADPLPPVGSGDPPTDSQLRTRRKAQIKAARDFFAGYQDPEAND